MKHSNILPVKDFNRSRAPVG